MDFLPKILLYPRVVVFDVEGAVTTGNVDISLSADTTAWRSDVEYQSYRASLKFRF